MNEPMHDLLAGAIDRRTHAFAESSSFADAHRGRVLRSIRARRAAAYGGTGTAAAVLAVGAGFGVRALTHDPLTLFPANQPSPDASIAIPHITPAAMPSVTPVPTDLATPLATTLVQVPLDDSIWPAGETYRSYVFFASPGATDMIPFPASGIWYPGIPDVPSDAVLLFVDGYVGGFDFAAPHTDIRQIQAYPAWTNAYDMAGGLRGAGSQFDWEGHGEQVNWDVIGDVTDHSRWGIHYFLLNGDVATLVDGRANPDAIEVTAWFDPASFTPSP